MSESAVKKIKMRFKKYSHQYWILKAIETARCSLSTAHCPEVPVSALVVKGNKLLSKSINQVEAGRDATLHAEIVAIREASKVLSNWRLNDCTLYVTLEPCVMCAGAILNSRISKLIFGAYDVQMGACGSKYNILENKVDVYGGVLELEASKLLKEFFESKRNLKLKT